MRFKNRLTDPEKKMLLDAKHTKVLIYTSDFLGMVCRGAPCGRSVMDVNVCYFCSHSEITAGSKELLIV